jgi:glyoxylase-like metal-dependent hydrolase (beta-lactamase superfamily II)
MTTQIKPFFDERTYTLTYVVFDPETRDAVVIDPVLDYEPVGSKIWTESVDDVLEFLKNQELNVHYVLETHAHADHLSGSQWIKEEHPKARSAIGENITVVQDVFKGVFDLPATFATDGSQFDELLTDGQVVHAGSIPIEVIFTPGHTPACATYKVEDSIFTGDALFMPDVGTGRCDFPAGSSTDLYESVTERLYGLPDDTRVFVGHDYPEGRGREAAWETTIAESKASNVALPAKRDRDDFTAWRDERDSGLAAPRLLFQSVQVNVDAGRLPEPHANEKRYLRIPINVFRPVPNPGAQIVEEAV